LDQEKSGNPAVVFTSAYLKGLLANCRKHKVKVTPGTGKRGKAVKTAMAMFVNDRAASSREKDLLKSMKEQDLARNLPAKIKISAPQLHKNK
jgi:hypothetical protein